MFSEYAIYSDTIVTRIKEVSVWLIFWKEGKITTKRRKDNYEKEEIHRRSMIASVKRLHKAGQKAKEIADYLGIPESKVRKILFDR